MKLYVNSESPMTSRDFAPLFLFGHQFEILRGNFRESFTHRHSNMIHKLFYLVTNSKVLEEIP